MKVLIGCECSGNVRRAFRDLGYDAWSCDLKPAEDNDPHHYQGDVLDILDHGWDLAIFHPVCKYLANSGNKHLYKGMKKENGIYWPRWHEAKEGAQFYAKLWDAPIPHVAVENPIWHCHAAGMVDEACEHPHPKKRQFVQPWMFGHLESKATGLALRDLPPLVPTDNVHAAMMELPINIRHKVHYATPGPEREADRSRTFQGIADAMAKQWGRHVRNAQILG